MQRKFLFTALAFFGLFNMLSAQTSVSTLPTFFDHFSGVANTDNSDWTFYHDSQNDIYYIDFEEINVNLNDLKVLDQFGEVIWKESLWDLPVNSIYELDMKHFEPGDYQIQLRTYTGVIQRDVRVEE